MGLQNPKTKTNVSNLGRNPKCSHLSQKLREDSPSTITKNTSLFQWTIAQRWVDVTQHGQKIAVSQFKGCILSKAAFEGRLHHCDVTMAYSPTYLHTYTYFPVPRRTEWVDHSQPSLSHASDDRICCFFLRKWQVIVLCRPRNRLHL